MIRKKWNEITFKQLAMYTATILCCIASIIFVYHNYSLYTQPIAQVIHSDLQETTAVTDMYDNEDKLFIQHLTAEIKNGKNKGSIIHLTNEYSSSGAYDQSYETGNDVFISIDKQQAENEALTGSISNVKRDKYIVIVAWVFIIILDRKSTRLNSSH